MGSACSRTRRNEKLVMGSCDQDTNSSGRIKDGVILELLSDN
jgi:hypothetical protein